MKRCSQPLPAQKSGKSRFARFACERVRESDLRRQNRAEAVISTRIVAPAVRINRSGELKDVRCTWDLVPLK